MRHYPSKLLLFGEYIILLGARALAVPVPAFSGQWAEAAADQAEEAQQGIKAFAESPELAQTPGLDTARFKMELEQGLYFKSNIPYGYGLGSSGALCAAVYDRFAREKTENLSELKRIFAGMESYFHGQSSGIDPLTSYLDRSLWIENKQDVWYFEPKPWEKPAPVIFLLDSQLPRQTGPLVQWFMREHRNPSFIRGMERQLWPGHQTLLHGWEERDPAAFWEGLRAVSAFQLDFMPLMIPEHLRPLWRQCLEKEDILLKICGAGGGGFVLGFGRDKTSIIEQLNRYPLVFPFENHVLVEE